MIQKNILLIYRGLWFFYKKSAWKFMEFAGLLRLSIASNQLKWVPVDWLIVDYIPSLKRCLRFGWRSFVVISFRQGGRFWADLKGGLPIALSLILTSIK